MAADETPESAQAAQKLIPDAEQLAIETEVRRAAHQALDRWLDECEREGRDTFDSGHTGYIGRIKLCAFVHDDGIALRIERSFSEDLWHRPGKFKSTSMMRLSRPLLNFKPCLLRSGFSTVPQRCGAE